MNNTISNKLKELSLMFILFSFILVLSNIVIKKYFFESNTQRIAMDNALKKSIEREENLNIFLKELQHELMFFRKIDSFNNYLADNRYKQEFSDIIVHYMESHPEFMEVKYLDKNGFEQIRINRDATNTYPYKISKDNLQNKANEYYFKASKAKSLEEVWFSKIDLNMEHNQLQFPATPILKAILPIKYKDHFGGVLIISYFMDNFLHKFIDAPLYDMILCDEKGFSLIHYEKDKNWGFYTQPKYNISQEFPNTFQKILNNQVVQTDTFVSKKLNSAFMDNLIVIFKLKQSYMTEENNILIFKYLTIATIIPIIVFILTMILIKLLRKNLFNLNKLSQISENFETITKAAKIGFSQIDWQTNAILWSDEVYNIFEIENKNTLLTKEKLLSYIPNIEREIFEEKFQDSINKKKEYFITHKIVTDRGNTKYLQRRGKHYFDKNGILLKSMGSIYDITEQYLSENKYKTLLDFASDGIHILDTNGNLIEFSQSFAQSLGYTNEEMKTLNLKDWEVSTPNIKIQEWIQNLIDSPTSFQTKQKRKDGTLIDVQINAKGIILNNQKYLYASQQDITQQKRLEAQIIKEKDFISTIVDNANAIIAVIDSNGRMIKVNKYAQNFVGYNETEIASKPYFWARFLPADMQNKVLNIVKKANEGEIIKHFKNSWISKSGEEKIFEWSNMLVKKEDGSMDYIATIGIDVTTSVKASNAKSEFLANMSHEIRTPLNGVIGLINIVTEMPLDALQKEYLQKANQSAISLLNLINDILDYSKIEAGKLNLANREFYLEDIFKNISTLFEYKASHKHVKLLLSLNEDIPKILIGDALKLTQILNNLVGNALKFTHKGHVKLDGTIKEINKTQITIEFCVEDTGIGISLKNQSRLFQSFEQLDNTHKKSYEGTGLGLAISKELVEHMGGKIWLESKEHIGSKFYFQVVLKYTNAENRLLKNSVRNESKHLILCERKKALLVEDNETNQIVVKAILEKMGFIIEIANDGFEAITCVKRNKYDIVFMDLQMPKMDGFEATKKIREFDNQIPIIALSAAVMEKDKRLTFEAGMDGHISKPIITNEILDLVSKYFDFKTVSNNLKHSSKPQALKLYGIDFEKLMKSLSFNETQALSLVKKYYKSYNNVESNIEQLRSSNQKFIEFIHKLKGTSGNIQANKVFDICLRIENRNNDLFLSQWIHELKTEMKKISQSIETNVMQKPTEDEDKKNNKGTVLIINKLIKDLTNDNYIHNSRIDKLLSLLTNKIDKELLRKLDNSFSKYEYKELIEYLKTVQKNLIEG